MADLARFSLEVTILAKPEEALRQFREGNTRAENALAEDGSAEEPGTWYAHEEDLRAFSEKHPGLLFKLSGEGEDQGDAWDKYFVNGKMQECRVVAHKPSFDPKELK